MTNYTAWLDSEKARVFALKPSRNKKSHLKQNCTTHHTQHQNEYKTNIRSEFFFRELACNRSDAKKAVGLQNGENITDKPILAETRKFFKHYDMYKI